MYVFKKVVLIVFFISLSQISFAKDCMYEVARVATDEASLQKHDIESIVKTDIILEPGEDKSCYMEEIWNSSDKPLQVYLVSSAYMGSFKHTFLVDPNTCEVENIILVFFE